jgi:hypothetical protein
MAIRDIFKKKKTPEELEEERRIAANTLLGRKESNAFVSKLQQLDIPPIPEEKPEKFEAPRKISPEDRKRILQANPGSAVDEFGNVSLPLTDPTGGVTAEGKKRIFGTQELSEGAGVTSRELEKQQQQANLLGAQVGQFEQLDVSPTGLDVGEAILKGAVEGIPRAIGTIAGLDLLGSAVGGKGAATTAGKAATVGKAGRLGGVLGKVNPYAAAGTALAFISESIVSDFKEQRRNMNERPRVVLQDGKTSLGALVTLAANDPARRMQHLADFNTQLALIEQAHRQVKLDTSRDVVLFERSEDVLADFNSFYDPGSERDQVVAEMQAALGADIDPEFIFRMNELNQRYNNEK